MIRERIRFVRRWCSKHHFILANLDASYRLFIKPERRYYHGVYEGCYWKVDLYCLCETETCEHIHYNLKTILKNVNEMQLLRTKHWNELIKEVK